MPTDDEMIRRSAARGKVPVVKAVLATLVTCDSDTVAASYGYVVMSLELGQADQFVQRVTAANAVVEKLRVAARDGSAYAIGVLSECGVEVDG